MLGRLAKWLRILGFDTAYSSAWDDAAVVRAARAEDRMILTRDRAMALRRGISVFPVKSDEVEEQVQEVVAGLGLSTAHSFSRCPECNGILQAVKKAEVQDLVPSYVFSTQQSFHRCPDCGRIYWRGTHWDRMLQKLHALEQSLSHNQRGG